MNGFSRLWGRRSDSPSNRICRHPIGIEDLGEEGDQLMSSISSIEAGATAAIIDRPHDVRQHHASSIPEAHPAAKRYSR
jgi:hypothetical protein